MLGQTQVSGRCLTILRTRLGEENVRAIILTGNPTHPQLQRVVNTPVIEKPLSRANFDRIVKILGAELPWNASAFS
jgi:hypothetical protein